MRSKRAKEHIMCHTMGYDCTTIQRDSVMLHKEYAEHAVTLAEQDAEERHEKRIFEMQKLFVEVMKQKFGYRNALEVSAEVSKMIIDNLNNGGQSDE